MCTAEVNHLLWVLSVPFFFFGEKKGVKPQKVLNEMLSH